MKQGRHETIPRSSMAERCVVGMVYHISTKMPVHCICGNKCNGFAMMPFFNSHSCMVSRSTFHVYSYTSLIDIWGAFWFSQFLSSFSFPFSPSSTSSLESPPHSPHVISFQLPFSPLYSCWTLASSYISKLLLVSSSHLKYICLIITEYT